MRDECNGLPQARRQRSEFSLQLGAGDRIERAKRLIHQEDWRIARQGSRDAHTLTLAAGKFAGVPTGEFGKIQTDECEHFANTVADACFWPAFEARHQRNVALDGPVREQTDILNDITDAATQTDGIPLRLIATLDEDRAFGGFEQTVYQLERGGFARAAASQEHERFSRGDGKT